MLLKLKNFNSGIALIIFLLGYGLVEIPRIYWRKRDWNI